MIQRFQAILSDSVRNITHIGTVDPEVKPRGTSTLNVYGSFTVSGTTTFGSIVTPSGGATTGFIKVLGKTSGGLKLTSADAAVYIATVSLAAQTVGAVTLTIPDMAGAANSFVFTALAQTLTNKTLTSPSIITPTITGVSGGSDASSGIVGEIISSVVAVGSAVSLVSGTAKTVTSISLTAGDWDITGVVDFHPGATTTGSYFQAGVSGTTNALGSQDQYASAPMALAAGLGVDVGMACPTVRQSLSGATTIYLTCQAGFALSTLTAYGTIRARRVR